MARLIVETKGFKKIGARYKHHSKFRRLARKRMSSLGSVLLKYARAEAPKDTGRLRDGLGFRVRMSSGGAQLNLTSRAKHTGAVIYGTRPHMPPVSAIAGWAKRRGMDPWAVAMGIKKAGTSWGAVRKYGTRRNPFMNRALEKGKGRVKREGVALVQNMAGFLNGKKAV